MYALLSVIEKLRFPSKRFLPTKHWNCKYTTNQVFLLTLLFPCFGIKSMYDYAECALYKVFSASKDVFYRFISDGRIDWRGLLYCINLQLLSKIQVRSDHRRSKSPTCLMVDDTDFPKSGGKAEKLGRVFSHVRQTSILGYKGLFLGWTDGKTQLMLDSALLGEKGRNPEKPFGTTATQKSKQYHTQRKEDEAIMERINEYSISKIELLKQMVRRAIKRGIRFDYLLADSWFACTEIIEFIRTRGIHCHYLGMIKMGNTRYEYKGTKLIARDLVRKIKKAKGVSYSRKLRCYYAEVEVTLAGKNVKLFFCRRGTHGDWNALISTNLSLSFLEAYKIYSMRWSIEVFFKEAKGLLGLGKSQTRDFASQVAALSIAMLQYNILSTLKRFQSYETLGELFRSLAKESLELSLNERIWQTILNIAQEIADIFEMGCSEVMDKLINHSSRLEKVIRLYAKDKVA
jgi:hypothetical protein